MPAGGRHFPLFIITHSTESLLRAGGRAAGSQNGGGRLGADLRAGKKALTGSTSLGNLYPNTKFGAKNSQFGAFWGKTEIFSTHILLCWKFDNVLPPATPLRPCMVAKLGLQRLPPRVAAPIHPPAAVYYRIQCITRRPQASQNNGVMNGLHTTNC